MAINEVTSGYIDNKNTIKIPMGVNDVTSMDNTIPNPRTKRVSRSAFRNL